MRARVRLRWAKPGGSASSRPDKLWLRLVDSASAASLAHERSVTEMPLGLFCMGWSV
jgi:hypothetical protein